MTQFLGGCNETILRLVLSSSLQSLVFSCLASLLFSNTVAIYLVSVALDGLVSSLSHKQSKKQSDRPAFNFILCDYCVNRLVSSVLIFIHQSPLSD